MAIEKAGGAGSARPDLDLAADTPMQAGQPPLTTQQGSPQQPDPIAPTISRQPTSSRPIVGVASTVPDGASGPEATVRAFYDAFTSQRWDEVGELYAPDLQYNDPLFAHHDSASTIRMWRTLLQADDLKTTWEITGVDGDVVTGRWTADYNFHGRPVHEVSESRFQIKGGRIVSHHDDFSVVAWARQALPLGPLDAFADTTLGRAVITRLMRFGIQLAERDLPER